MPKSMLAQGSRKSICVFLLGLLIAPIAHAGYEIGSAPGAIGGVQAWHLIDNDRAVITISGTVTRPVTVFTATDSWEEPWADHDWNIHLFPRREDQWSRVNDDGETNLNGLIELELNTSRPQIGGIDLSSLLPEGSYLQARGWWVADEGHDNKTELHPIRWLRGGTSERYFVLVGQDGTGRFSPPNIPLEESVELELALYSPTGVRRSSNVASTFERHATATLLQEEAWVDHWVMDPIGITQSQFSSILGLPDPNSTRTRATYEMSRVDKITLDTNLPPVWTSDPFPLDPAPKRMQAPYLPVYLGKFTRSQGADLLAGQSNYRVERDASGMQVVRATIRVDVSDAGRQLGDNEQISYSLWRYPGGSNGELVTASKTSNHWIEFDAIYAPWQGNVSTSWKVEASASTREPNWYPGMYEPPKYGLNGPWRRSWLRDEHTFYLEPSYASFSSNVIPETVSKGEGDDREERQCESSYHIYWNERIVPGVDVSRHWVIESIAGPDGTSVAPSQPLPKRVPSSGQLRLPGASFEVDPNNPRQLIVVFDSSGWTGNTNDLAWAPTNQSRFRIFATIETGVGERLSAQKLLFLPHCYSPIVAELDRPSQAKVRHPRGIPWSRDTVERTLAAMLVAKSRGLMRPERPWPAHPLPVTAIRKAFPNGLPQLGHPESFVRRLPREGKQLLEAYRKVLAGEALTSLDQMLLDATVETGSKLPRMQPRRTKEMSPRIPTAGFFVIERRESTEGWPPPDGR